MQVSYAMNPNWLAEHARKEGNTAPKCTRKARGANHTVLLLENAFLKTEDGNMVRQRHIRGVVSRARHPSQIFPKSNSPKWFEKTIVYDSFRRVGELLKRRQFRTHGRRMGETRPGTKSMKKSVVQQQHKEVAQVHPITCGEILELQEYAVGSSPTDYHPLSSSATFKLTAKPREPPITRRKVSDETKEEIQAEDEATLRELLMRYVLVQHIFPPSLYPSLCPLL
ncbi:Uncharacterized protein GBIM_12790 [Gryllus bimaculatus]|nr:Uncharacterized protein GBIM_12790 [Gryllus bimaculatus]